MPEKKWYAELKWSIEDVESLFAGASDAELHDWFARNEKLRDGPRRYRHAAFGRSSEAYWM